MISAGRARYRSTLIARASIAAIIIAVASLGTACVPEGTESGASGSASSASARPTPTRAATPSFTPSASAAPTTTPSPGASASAAPTSTPSAAPPAPPEMTRAQAADACAQLYGDSGSMSITGSPRVEERSVDPHWFVSYPGSNEYGPGVVVCILGGDPAQPDVLVVIERTRMTEAEVRRDLASNAQYQP